MGDSNQIAGELWGIELKNGATHKIEIDEEKMILLTGVCCDVNVEKGFKSLLVVKATDEETKKTTDMVVACLTEGNSENVTFEVPLHNGNQITNKSNKKGSIHVFGRYVDLFDEDEEEGEFTEEMLGSMMPSSRLAGEDDAEIEELDSDEEDESEKKEEEDEDEEPLADEMEEEEEEDDEEDDKDDDEEEEDLENLLKGRFGSKRVVKQEEKKKNGKEVAKPTPKAGKPAKESVAKKAAEPQNGKRKISTDKAPEEKKKEETKKQKVESSAGKPSKDAVIGAIKEFIKAEKGSVELQAIGNKLHNKFNLGFKQLGLGAKLTDFIKEADAFKVDGGKVFIK